MNKKDLVEKLRLLLTLQIDAYYRSDWEFYDKLEFKIKKLQKTLVG